MEYISKKYYKKLKKELLNLENIKRPFILNEIKKAIEKGDLSENYEYISSKESLELLELKIEKIKNILLNSKTISKKNIKNKKKVNILSIVTIKNLKTNKISTYQIVSSSEANVFKNKISIDSPMSLSLLGKKKGDIIKYINNIYKIIKIKI